MKKTLITLALLAMCACPCKAEIQTFTDGYISFEYDDEAIGDLTGAKLPDAVHYNYFTNYKESDVRTNQVNIAMKTVDDIKEYLTEKQEDGTIPKIISEDPLQVVSVFPDEGTYTRTVVGNHENQYVISSIFVADENSDSYDSCRRLYDSATVTDEFLESGYDFEKSPVGMFEEIYSRMYYSKQAIAYAQKALETCEQYMNMEISGKEAADVFEELERRSDSYRETTEYSNDSDVYFAVSNEAYNFEYGKDAEILETMETLQRIVDIGTDEE